MIIATSHYGHGDAILASGLVPLATSLGIPKWRLRYELAGQVAPLAPLGIFRVVEFDDPAFERLYVDRLAVFGAPAIEALLGSFAAAYRAEGVVLLCWEKEPHECHRSIFARWWAGETGQPVEELEALQQQLTG